MDEFEYKLEVHNFLFWMIARLNKKHRWQTIEEMLNWFTDENTRLTEEKHPDISDVESGDVK